MRLLFSDFTYAPSTVISRFVCSRQYTCTPCVRVSSGSLCFCAPAAPWCIEQVNYSHLGMCLPSLLNKMVSVCTAIRYIFTSCLLLLTRLPFPCAGGACFHTMSMGMCASVDRLLTFKLFLFCTQRLLAGEIMMHLKNSIHLYWFNLLPLANGVINDKGILNQYYLSVRNWIL